MPPVLFSALERETIQSLQKISNETRETSIFNLLTPMSDQDRISPYNIKTISSIQVIRIKKNISLEIIR